MTDKHDTSPSCYCTLCKLDRTFSSIAKKCTDEEKEALDIVWGRMECAESRVWWLERQREQERDADIPPHDRRHR